MAYGFNDNKSKVEVVKKDNFIFYRQGNKNVPANDHITISVSYSALGVSVPSQYTVIGAMQVDYFANAYFDRVNRNGQMVISVDLDESSMNIRLYNNYSVARDFGFEIMLMKKAFA